MENTSQAGILRIFVSSTDRIEQQPLFEYIVFLAKKEGLAGATVLKGILGFGASSVIHSYKFWEVSDKVPTVIELIDEMEKIRTFYNKIRPKLEEMKYGCLVTLDQTNVVLYKSGPQRFFDV
jgi:hypothetical protein